MKCPKCGFENPENAKFCRECGMSFTDKGFAEKGGGMKSTSEASPSVRGVNIKILLLIIGFVVIVGVAAYYFLPSLFSSPQQATVLIVPAVSGSAVVTYNGSQYPVNLDYYALSQGSGFIVSDQGHIVTAAHVVSDPYDLRYQGKIRKMEQSDIEWYVAQGAIYLVLQKTDPDVLEDLTQEDMDDLTNEALSSGAVEVKNANLDIYVIGGAFPESMTEKDYIAHIVDFEATDNQEKDVALLKVDNPPKNLPKMSISSQKPNVGDTVSIYGYPIEQMEFAKYMESTGNQKQFLESMANATLTKGIVSAERISPRGTQYFQTDAPVNKGNSGGPVLNSNNQVIGVLVFKLGETGNYNFFISSQYVIDMLKQNGINV